MGTVTVEDLAPGSFVNWTSSPGVTLSSSTGITVSITNVDQTYLSHWVEATINANGCQQTIRKTFGITPNSGNSFEIVEIIEACYPPSHPLGRYGTVPATNAFWDVNHGNVFPMQGTFTYFEPDQEGWFTITATAAGGCNGPIEVSKDFYVEECKPRHPKRIAVSPNPSNDVINIQLENYDFEKDYQIVITNHLGELKYEGEKSDELFQLDVSQYLDGIYYLHIFQDSDYKSVSFIVSHN